MALTIKQELFVAAYCSNGYNGTRAAIVAGYSESSAKEIASQNLTKPEIAEAIDAHKLMVNKRCGITLQSLIDELEEARVAALTAETVQSSAAVAATQAKAKLTGMDKLVIDNISSDGSMTPKGVNVTITAADVKAAEEAILKEI
jgi:phage terminase small subunit